MLFLFFFFNDPATTEIYTLSLHDALPISAGLRRHFAYNCDYSRSFAAAGRAAAAGCATNDESRRWPGPRRLSSLDRKSTRLNSSHGYISYAVFCLKKKNTAQHVHLAAELV